MKITLFKLIAAVAMFLLLPLSEASAKLKVVATVPDLASIVSEVGGDRVEVKSIAKGYEDPHFVSPKPSFVLMLNKADLLLHAGLDNEAGWLPALITGARNSAINIGGQGNLDCSSFVANILEIPTSKIDRSMGDVHPGGNPHYLLDPRNAAFVARGIADKLASLDPENASYYRERLGDFTTHLSAKIKTWESRLAPHKGVEIVTYHKSWVYFSNWAGFSEAGYVEPVPGIPPSPSYVADLIRKMQAIRLRLVIAESFYPQKTPAIVAQKAGAAFVTLPSSVGGRDDVKTYFDLFDVIVGEIVAKLAAK
ncbi:MAG: metal ABC transporter substrate-binding protein [Deltaproteobacteria bacterium]